MPTDSSAILVSIVLHAASSLSKSPLRDRHLISGGVSGYVGVCENTRPSRAVCDSSPSGSVSSPSPRGETEIW